MSPVHSRSVQDAIEWMSANLADDIRIDDVARKMRFSKWHSTRVFAQVTGMTPGRYLGMLRLERAAVLLTDRNPRMKIIDVATAVGYTSAGTFCNTFTTYWGVPPSKFAVSRCLCGLFDGRSHSTLEWCRAAEGELCTRCHQCLDVREKGG